MKITAVIWFLNIPAGARCHLVHFIVLGNMLRSVWFSGDINQNATPYADNSENSSYNIDFYGTRRPGYAKDLSSWQLIKKVLTGMLLKACPFWNNG